MDEGGEKAGAGGRVLLHGPVATAIYTRTAPVFPFRRGTLRFEPDDGGAADWLVLGLPNQRPVPTRVPRARRILVVGEPSGMSPLPEAYLAQFGAVVSPFLPEGYSGRWIQSHAGLPWFYGARRIDGELAPVVTFEQLAALPAPEKRDAVSVVISSKVLFPGHRRRLAFVAELKKRLGDRLEVFGRGFREIDDKADAIAPFALHLALENSQEPSYWTEKLSDAFLGWALPLYSGCPDIGRWFPDDSLVPVDVNDPGAAEDAILGLLETQGWRKRLPAIQEARRRVLTQETFFNVVERAIGAVAPHTAPVHHVDEALQPAGKLPFLKRLRREVKRSWHKATVRVRLQ